MKRLLGTLLACAAAATAMSTPASRASVVAAAQAPTTYDVSYAEIVVVPSGEPATLAFEGRRGQLVALRTSVGSDEYPKDCESIVLQRRGSTVTQTSPGLWRLPATGSYRVDYVQDCKDPYDKYGATYDSRVWLVKVVVGRLGDALRHGVRSEAPTVRAISVRLGERPLLLDEAYVVPARTPADDQNLTQSWCGTPRVVAGKKPVTVGGEDCTFRARAGARYLVFGTKDSTVRLGRG